MRVIGFDPELTVARAMQLSSGVERTSSLDDLFCAPSSSHCMRHWSRRRGIW
jgi:hypothetical protein